MFNVGFHEYVRIVLPAVLFVGFLILLFPVVGEQDGNRLLLMAAAVGLMVTPLFDWFAKKWFHRQVLRMHFYEELIESFLLVHDIVPHEEKRGKMSSFSGSIPTPESIEGKCVLEAYKTFSRHGWSGDADSYRIRTEKSIGMLYFSMACYFLAAMILIGTIFAIPGIHLNSKLGHPIYDLLVTLIPVVICLIESHRRFHASLQNEKIVIAAHMSELKSLYDGIHQVLTAKASKDSRVANGQPIKAVVFDVGGVIHRLLDSQLITILANKLDVPVKEFNSHFDTHIASVQSGKLSEIDFLKSAKHAPEATLPDDYIEWFTEAFRTHDYVHEEILNIISKIKTRVDSIAVLSNTIPSHAAFNRKRGNYSLFGKNVLLSNEIGAVKPSRKAFEAVTRTLGCNFKDILFIDDMPANVEKARELGSRAEVHDSDSMPPQHLIDIMRMHGVNI